MGVWILVMVFQANVWLGWGEEQVEYQSKEDCLQALKEAKTAGFDKFRAYCKPKAIES